MAILEHTSSSSSSSAPTAGRPRPRKIIPPNQQLHLTHSDEESRHSAFSLFASSPVPKREVDDDDDIRRANQQHERHEKRKEQNRLAQRRHREKQRQEDSVKKRRIGSGGSYPPIDDEGQATASSSSLSHDPVPGVTVALSEGSEGPSSSSAAGVSARSNSPNPSKELDALTAAQTRRIEQNIHVPVPTSDSSSMSTHEVGSAALSFPHDSGNSYLDPLAMHIAQSYSGHHGQMLFPPQTLTSPLGTTREASTTSAILSDPMHALPQRSFDAVSQWPINATPSPFDAARSDSSSATIGTLQWTAADPSLQASQSYAADPPHHLGLQQAQQAHITDHQSLPYASHQIWRSNASGGMSDQQMQYSPIHQEQAMRQFVCLVSEQIPWADQLLSPRWDMIKVLKLAAEQLGLLYDYIEGDDSVSFLDQDYQQASRKAILPVEDMKGASNQTLHISKGDFQDSASSTHGQSSVYTHAIRQGLNKDVSALRWHVWPENMRPSKLSGVVSHHPFLDLAFPWPQFRTKIFAAMSCNLLDEREFCYDVWPGERVEDGSRAESPYTVHGDDAFDPAAYEISNRFALRYAPLIDASIFRRTNWWRRQRGKEELPKSILEVGKKFESFFQAQIRHLLQPERSPAPSTPPITLPLPIQVLGNGTPLLNGQSQTMDASESRRNYSSLHFKNVEPANFYTDGFHH